MGGLTEMLGMGIAIQLRNMFSAPAMAVVNSSRVLTEAITKDQAKTMNGWRLMAGGASMMFVGTGMLAFLGYIAKASLKASSDLEIFRLQIRLLAKDSALGDGLFDQLKIFSTTTPFTIPQVMAGAKNLMSFGFGAERVLKQLKLAGDWASMMNMPIEEASMILGKVRSGALSYAMRSLQRAGIGYADIAAAGGPIDPKTMRTKKGADPEKFLAAVNKVIEQKFGGSMAVIMQTIPGMWTNIKDQLILMGSTIGDIIKPQIKDVMHGILGLFNPALVLPFAKAVGDGLSFILKVALIVLTPIGKMVTWFMALANAHPGVVKLILAMTALVGVTLNVAGAAMILLGVWNIIEGILAAESTAMFVASLGAMIGPILAVAAAAVLLYTMYRNNFLGIADVTMHVWGQVRAVGGALIELFSSIRGGVGYMSQDTADKLKSMGLYGVVIQLFMIGYRVYRFFMGIVEGVMSFIKVVSFLVSTLYTVLIPFILLGEMLLKVADAMFDLNLVGKVGADRFEQYGKVVGFVLGIVILWKAWTIVAAAAQWAWSVAIVVCQGVMGAFRLAMIVFQGVLWLVTNAYRVATGAQWLLNIAMDANPVGVVIGAIGILITMLILFYMNIDKITKWFNNLPMWAKVLVTVITMLTAPLYVVLYVLYNYGGRIIDMFGRVKDKIVSAIHAIVDAFQAMPPWLRIGGAAALMPILGPMPLAGAVAYQMHQPALNQTQSQQLASQTVARQQESHLRDIHGELQTMNQHLNTPKPMPPVVLQVDGKTLATTVNKYNGNEKSSGR